MSTSNPASLSAAREISTSTVDSLAANIAAEFTLPAGIVFPIDPRPNLTLHALAGELWITQAGDGRDIILTPGQSFTPAPRGRVAVQSLSDARISVTGIVGNP